MESGNKRRSNYYCIWLTTKYFVPFYLQLFPAFIYYYAVQKTMMTLTIWSRLLHDNIESHTHYNKQLHHLRHKRFTPHVNKFALISQTPHASVATPPIATPRVKWFKTGNAGEIRGDFWRSTCKVTTHSPLSDSIAEICHFCAVLQQM